MLPEVDVIDVCTPGYVHESVSITALEAGKHVVVEKPFTGYYGPSGDETFMETAFPNERCSKRLLPVPNVSLRLS
jgi:hypothetical protein